MSSTTTKDALVVTSPPPKPRTSTVIMPADMFDGAEHMMTSDCVHRADVLSPLEKMHTLSWNATGSATQSSRSLLSNTGTTDGATARTPSLSSTSSCSGGLTFPARFPSRRLSRDPIWSRGEAQVTCARILAMTGVLSMLSHSQKAGADTFVTRMDISTLSFTGRIFGATSSICMTLAMADV
eukprot:scaffold172_cov254-Pinguiococcus_pyrenoidosus.AAC.26